MTPNSAAYLQRHTVTALLALAAGSAAAAPPVPFDTWTRNSTGVAAPCPTGYTCDVNVTDNNILQRVLTGPDGKRYIQLIVTGTQGTSSMSTESYVVSGGQNGIALKQKINDTGATSLQGTTTINTGWANNTAAPSILVQQTVSNTAPSGVGMVENFSFSEYRNASGVRNGSFLDIREDITDSTNVSPDTTATGRDVQSFVTRVASGNQVARAGSTSLPAATNGMMGGGGPTGGTLGWRAGDTVQVVWIGQICEGCQNTGMDGGGMGGGMGGGGDALFSYQAYDNLSDTSAAIATRSLLTTNPTNWVNPPFGTQPTMQ